MDEPHEGTQGLADLAGVVGPAAVEERVTVEVPVGLHSQQLGDRREDVERRRRRVDRPAALLPWALDEQRHAVAVLEVLGHDLPAEHRSGEARPVIGHHDHQGLVPDALGLERVDHVPDGLIGRHHLQHMGLVSHLGVPEEGR